MFVSVAALIWALDVVLMLVPWPAMQVFFELRDMPWQFKCVSVSLSWIWHSQSG
jgi:hypothetical protein